MLHAKLSPSKAERWLVCTAAPHLEADMPEERRSEYANEGTEAHALLERSIKARIHPSKLEPEHPAAADVAVLYEQVEGFLLDPAFSVFSEIRVKLSEEVWGTLDLAILGRGELFIIDYKHGAGVPVDVPSAQLEIYAAAALPELSLFEEVERVYTMIVQPRAQHSAGPVRSMQYSPAALADRAAEILAIAADISAGNVEFCPGEKQCRFCRASGNCKAQADAALELARARFSVLESGDTVLEHAGKAAVETLTKEEKLAIVFGSGQISQFLSAVYDSVAGAMEAGESYPGAKLVAGRSNRTWGRSSDRGEIQKLADDEVIDFLVTELKLKRPDILETKLMGPAKIEKLIDPKARNGKKKAEMLETIIVKPQGKPTIVPENDPRPGIQPYFQKVEPVDPLA